MADTHELPTILGLFPNQAAAEGAVDRLAAAGFTAGEIGLLATGEAHEPNFLKAEATGVATGGALGGVAGAILGAVTVGAIPGIGPVIVAGALLPVLVLAVTGASAGATMGGLFAAAATQDQGLHYVQEVRSGRALVTVTTGRPEEARAALATVGAIEVADLGRSETAHKVADEQAPEEPAAEERLPDEPA